MTESRREVQESKIWILEEAIRTLPHAGGNGDLQETRLHLARVLLELCDIPQSGDRKNLTKIIEAAKSASNGRRDAAILSLRALAIDGLFPFDSELTLARHLVEFIEETYADQLRSPRASEKRQTFEKLDTLKGFHASQCQELQAFANPGATLADINALVPDLQRIIRKGGLNSYLNPYGWTSIKAKVNQVCEQVTALQACSDASFKQRFDMLESTCTELDAECGLRPSFLTRDYICRFASFVHKALEAVRDESAGKFACEIEPRKHPPEIAAKRYPLHIADKWLIITLPFVNRGPGVAVNVNVELDSGVDSGLALEDEILNLGDVPPGEFAIAFRAMVVTPMQVSNLVIQLNWGELFGGEKSSAISLKLIGQDSDVDWESLEHLEPYSLDVADGERFVGRRSKMQVIGNRLMRAQMSSTYITGQKRIGKTSMAQAVQRYLVENAKPPIQHRIMYLEWGDYSNADPTRTVQALGDAINEFLCSHLPPSTLRPNASFVGTLAPLNTVARLLEQHCPNDRFILILDEFDEIHPEMYRFGSLAEAFFSNLRTLSAKKNIAFILVGGEKMPFIIGAQGDQLNKFSREQVDYFSRSEEWHDYEELVVGPLRDSINWQESAINELFTSTAGHPYYTKLVCSTLFHMAVTERDTEVIVADVKRAVNQRVSELDTNAFAHFWKDGISGDREDSEVLELKRLRVLVAFGRAARSGAVSRESLLDAARNLSLDTSSIGPVIDDFLRRDVFREVAGTIVTSLPLFQLWIRDVGVFKLITSTLADEIASEREKVNEAAYVKSGELTSLVSNWPLYRGRQVTAESVRSWLEQVSEAQEQRFLFKLLQNLTFVTPVQISDLLRQAQSVVSRVTPPLRRDNKVEKRRDLLVSYVGGAGKSSAYYARAYAKEASILLDCVIEPSRVARRLESTDEPPAALVIVDDFAATGQTISEALEKFLEPLAPQLEVLGLPIVVILLYATPEGQAKLAKVCGRFQRLNINLHIGVELGPEVSAFQPNDVGFWQDLTERDMAKALCTRLGTGLFKDALGFGNKALLIAFPEGCPNNSLPILFASRGGATPWTPLLPRPSS